MRAASAKFFALSTSAWLLMMTYWRSRSAIALRAITSCICCGSWMSCSAMSSTCRPHCETNCSTAARTFAATSSRCEQQIVELGLADDVAQDDLRAIPDRVLVVLHVQRRALDVDHLEVDDGVDPRRHVVGGDHRLLRQITVPDPCVYLHEPLDTGDHDVQTGAGEPGELAERELQAGLPLVHLPDGAHRRDGREEQQDDEDGKRGGVHGRTVPLRPELREAELEPGRAGQRGSPAANRGPPSGSRESPLW